MVMNLKKIQNLPNTPAGKLFNLLKWFKGFNPVCLSACLIISYKCNLNCDFCYQAKEKKEALYDMTIDDVIMIEKNIRTAFNFKPIVHIFGGEPTVNKDFINILRYFSREKYLISITTNGENIDQYIPEIAAKTTVREINISLNTMQFEKLLHTVRLFKDRDSRNNIYITLNCPINLQNQNNLMDIIRYFENSGVNCIAFQHTTLTAHYNPMIDFKIIRKQVEEIKKSRFNVPVVFLPDIKIDDIEKYYRDLSFPCKMNRCMASWVTAFIEPNGDVVPCEEVPIVMGSVKIEALKTIWNNDKYRKFRDDALRGGVSASLCMRCCHRRYY